MTPILIKIDLRFLSYQPPAIVDVYLDDQCFKRFSHHWESQQVIIDTKVVPGKHQLRIELRDKPARISPDEPDSALIIQNVKFQHVDQDFKIFSEYQSDNINSEKIHSNYMGHNGIWYLDFETPIYQWIHQKINLGWLI